MLIYLQWCVIGAIAGTLYALNHPWGQSKYNSYTSCTCFIYDVL